MCELKQVWIIGICVALGFAEARAAVLQEIVLTLDVSGSISNSELQLEIDGLKACLNDTSTVLHNGTVAVGIVVYGDTAANLVGLTPVTADSLTNVLEPALDGLLTDRIVSPNATNIGEGLMTAREMLTGGGSTTNNDSILLVGDGVANTGPDVPTECQNTANAGIVICAIAVGVAQTDPAVGQLRACAEDTGGSFGFAETFEDFQPVCEECFVFIITPACPGDLNIWIGNQQGNWDFEPNWSEGIPGVVHNVVFLDNTNTVMDLPDNFGWGRKITSMTVAAAGDLKLGAASGGSRSKLYNVCDFTHASTVNAYTVRLGLFDRVYLGDPHPPGGNLPSNALSAGFAWELSGSDSSAAILEVAGTLGCGTMNATLAAIGVGWYPTEVDGETVGPILGAIGDVTG